MARGVIKEENNVAVLGPHFDIKILQPSVKDLVRLRL